MAKKHDQLVLLDPMSARFVILACVHELIVQNIMEHAFNKRDTPRTVVDRIYNYTLERMVAGEDDKRLHNFKSIPRISIENLICKTIITAHEKYGDRIKQLTVSVDDAAFDIMECIDKLIIVNSTAAE